MRRVISIFLPHWLIEARRKRTQRSVAPDKPFAIIGQDGQRQVIVAVNRAARHEGIARGMPLTHARAIVPDLAVAPDEPEQDSAALRRLTLGCLRFSPLVAPCAPDGLWIDATGVAHLFGGEQAMLEKIARLLHRSGLTARVAIATTPGAAWAWARYGQTQISRSTDVHDVNPLPISALRIGSDAATALWRLGVKTIGDLRALPRATLPVRFGKDLLLRLDQALGRVPETLSSILPPAARRQALTFAEPISTPDALHWVTRKLAERLCADLEEVQEGARKIDLVFHRTDGSLQAVRIGTRRATRDAVHLLRLLTEHFDTVDPGFGIEAATLTAWRVETLLPTQTTTDGSSAGDKTDIAALVDVLSNRASHVYRLAAVASHVPERAVRAVDAMTIDATGWPAALPRPVRLFTPPEPADVMALMPDHPPKRFTWRGASHTVRHADGPERICGEWWREKQEVRETRDYFRVEDEDGGRYWLFRDNRLTDAQTYRWFVHGVFA
jgi:protein ImuB